MTANVPTQTDSAPTTKKRSFNIYKMVGGVALTIALVVVVPLLASEFNIISALAENAKFVLLITSIGLVIKAVMADRVAGEFLFYKFGYDNCVVAFGALLTALALQILSSVDLFPGMKDIALLNITSGLYSSPLSQRLAQLLILFLVSLAAMIVTGHIAAEIKQDKAAAPNLLSLFNSVVGTSLLGVYVLILITKG